MRVLFALPGLHVYNRGAEVAFISVASELAKAGDDVTLIGSGEQRAGAPYRFIHAGSIRRERFESFPSMPVLRHEYAYEDMTFAPSLARKYHPADYDVTLTCNYPFTNWVLRRSSKSKRPPHVFVTQNGDWAAYATNSEYRFFGCEGLVCTNPDFYARNRDRWRCRLIPNGVDCSRFQPGVPQRQKFGLPDGRMIVLMVSALISSKRVDAGIDAVSQIPDAHLVVAGDGPERSAIDTQAEAKLPGRFTRLTVTPEKMPALYQSADVFLHLSKEEAFGNVFLEAMACGLPVVAHDSARARWIVGEDEFLLDTEDSLATARNIKLASQSRSEKRGGRVAKAAAFSWSRIAAEYRSFLLEVVQNPAR